ncbi:MAG: hypothetical protein WA213_20745 [Terriglobales bacterium]
MASKRGDSFRGINLTAPVNRLDPGQAALAVNVRAYVEGGFTLRNGLGDPLVTVDSSVNSLARMNDTTPAGPSDGYCLIIGTDSGSMYVWTGFDSGPVATGLSGDPVSIVPFRPNTSVQPWAYIGDDAPYPNVIVDSGFQCAGMIKLRSDGLSRKTGIAEPQVAADVTFPGGGSGPSLIYYYYTYLADETGAESNPSPVSVPGTNSQANPSATQQAATSGVINPDITVNAAQYEGNGSQIRTTGGVAPGTVTDFIIAEGFGPTLAIPVAVNITGIQINLNWIGQNAGTGVLSSVALYYLGQQIGAAKFPAIQNQSIAVSTLQGGGGDAWGATLTPAIVNDPSFGFGVQITTQNSGGSDRSFINTMGVTAFYSTQDADITPTPSTDPQVNKINIYRQGGGLANPTYVGTMPNQSITYNDTLSDLAAAINPELQFDNYEPFPSIDLPRSGIINVDSTQLLTYVSGDYFNIRWLPGTIMLIGAPEQVAYVAPRRPSSTTSWDFSTNDSGATAIPQGTNLPWNIAEPDLAAQPLAYLFGPTDNVNYTFGVGDPLRPGTLYWCQGNNNDAAPDTNQMEVTDPSEPLVNGAMSGGLGVLFSIRRAWVIVPNFFNALATVTGTEGSTWTLQATAINRGLYMPRCLAVEGGGTIFFRVDDGIHFSAGGAQSVSITDGELYPLFPHESSGSGSSVPQPIVRNGVTIYPPDDSKPEAQRFRVQNAYLYYDHIGTDVSPHTWVLDIRTLGWIWDTYAGSEPTAHGTNEGQSQQGTLVGCSDGTVRLLESGSPEAVSGLALTPAIGGEGWMHGYELTVEYSCDSGATVSFIAADAGNGSYAPQAIVLESTAGQITKFTTKVSPNKFKLLQAQFTFSDPSMQVYLQGTGLSIKPWGSSKEFTFVPFFAGPKAGGEGPQQ